MHRILVILVCMSLLSVPIHAAVWYVRTSGDDTRCDGTSPDPYDPAGGSSQSCAFATVGKAVQQASCGDFVDVGSGHFYDLGAVDLSKFDCPGSFFEIRGAGRDVTFWHPRASRVTDCAADPGRANTYVCNWTVPSGTTVPIVATANFLERDMTSTVTWEDENGCKGDVTYLFPLTETTTSADDLPARDGHFYVDAAANKLYVNPWNDEPLNAPDKIIGPGSNVDSGADYAVFCNGCNNVKIRDLNIETPGPRAFYAYGSGSQNITLLRLKILGGTLYFYGGVHDYTVQDVYVAHQRERKDNETALDGQAWDVSTQSVVNSGSAFFTYDHVESYDAREGFSVSAGSHDGTLKRVKIHGHHNHGLKIQDDSYNITLSDSLLYNNQEGIFLSCAHDLTFKHVFMDYDMVIQLPPTGSCGHQFTNLHVYNSILRRVSWLSYQSPRAAGGHVFDYNTYIYENPGGGGYSDDPNASDSAALWRISEADVNYYTLADIQAGAGDPCSNCTNDPHSNWTRNWADVFVNYKHKSDLSADAVDYHHTATSPAIDHGGGDYGTPLDLDGTTRSVPYDNGPYDEASAGGGGGGGGSGGGGSSSPVTVSGVAIAGCDVK